MLLPRPGAPHPNPLARLRRRGNRVVGRARFRAVRPIPLGEGMEPLQAYRVLCLREKIQRLLDELHLDLTTHRIDLTWVVLGQRQQCTSYLNIVLDNGTEVGSTTDATWVAITTAINENRLRAG